MQIVIFIFIFILSTQIVKVLGLQSGLVKAELLRLLKDDNEEVLQGLIPHISEILDLLLQNQIIGADQTVLH